MASTGATRGYLQWLAIAILQDNDPGPGADRPRPCLDHLSMRNVLARHIHGMQRWWVAQIARCICLELEGRQRCEDDWIWCCAADLKPDLKRPTPFLVLHPGSEVGHPEASAH